MWIRWPWPTAGGNPTDRFTPRAATDLLRYWLEQPQAEEFREMLPELVSTAASRQTARTAPRRAKSSPRPGRSRSPTT